MTTEGQIKSFIDRVLRLKEEQDAIGADIRDVYAEAKSMGFDKTALGNVVAHVRKIEKKGADSVSEQSAIFDMYLSAYEKPHAPAPARTRENIEEIPPAPKRKTSGDDRHNDGGNGANEGGEDVDRGASARPSGQDTVGTQPPGVDGGNNVKSASGPDVKRAPHSEPGDDEVGAVNAQSGLPDTAGVEPSSPELIKKSLRPHCLNPDMCAGSGRDHCFGCRKALREREGEAA